MDRINIEGMTWIVSITLMVITLVISVCYYSLKKDELMSKNIDTAVEKGIDPLAVRCSYSSRDDIICIAYASSGNSSPTSPMPLPSKK
jgi:hypothetical protein